MNLKPSDAIPATCKLQVTLPIMVAGRVAFTGRHRNTPNPNPKHPNPKSNPIGSYTVYM